jgi:ABC-2 type transport system ATP-binding protein
MWAEISRLSTQEQVTVLLTTHYLEEADQLASQLAIVDHGRVVARGTPEELKRDLRGDTVTVELESAAGADRALALLRRADGLREAALDGLSLRARADSGPRAVPGVLAALEEAGVAVSAVTVARPSLDDVYLRHAGRSFEVAA